MQKKALGLLTQENYQELYDLSVGKVFSNRIELLEYIGNHANIDSDLLQCKLNVGENQYDVDFIGTSSLSDNMWFSAEVEEELPDEGVLEIIKVRKLLNQVGLGRLYKGKIHLSQDLTGEMLATIFTGFMPKEQAYFIVESGDISLYVKIKNLPQEIFAKIGAEKFVPRVLEIVNTTKVKNHKLMVESFALNNGCVVKVGKNKVAVSFDNGDFVFAFDDENKLINTNGTLGGKELKDEENEILSSEIADEETQDAVAVLPTEEPVEDIEEVETPLEEPVENVDKPIEDFENTEEVIDEPIEDTENDFVNEEIEDSPENNVEQVAEEVTEEIVEDIVEEPAEEKIDESAEDIVSIQDFPEDVEEVPQNIENDDKKEVVVNINTDIPDISEESAMEIEEVPSVEENNEVENLETETEDEPAPIIKRTKSAAEMAEAVLNCSEQSGLFETLGIEDIETINDICAETAIKIMQGDESINDVAECVTAACEKFGFTLDLNTATTFASCYYESYVLE